MESQLLFHVSDDAGVDVAAAGAHQHAGQRGEAHAGVHTFACVHGTDGAAVAQMAGDHFQVGIVQVLGGGHAHITVAGAMGAVAADGIFFIHLIRHAVHIRLFGHGLVEGGVENDNVGHLFAEHGLGAAQALHMGHVVHRGQRGDLLDLVDDGVGDDLGLGEKLGALHHAVADGRDLALVLHDGALAAGHHFNDLHKRFGVGGEGHFLFPLAAVGLVCDLAALDADALAQALAQHAFALHIDELILQRAGTTVDDQNFHPIFPPIHKKAQLCFLKSLHYYIMIIKHFQAHGRKRARKSEKNGQDSQFMRAQRPKEARQP